MHESGEDSGELIFAACRLEPMRKTRMPVAPCMERVPRLPRLPAPCNIYENTIRSGLLDGWSR